MRSLTLAPLGNEEIQGLLLQLAKAGLESAGDLEVSGEQPEGSDQARSGLRRLGEWLAAETGGQPFYLVETPKALIEEEKLVVRVRPDRGVVLGVGPTLKSESGLSGLVPSSVREVIRSRLSRLSPAATELLAAGAVLGRRFGFGSLLGVAGLGETECLRGLDELLDRRILTEEGGDQEERALVHVGVAYSFSHEKIRQVVYTEGGHGARCCTAGPSGY